MRDLGYPIPPFDLSVPGVSSLSADIHKYGFAAKGASVVLFADRDNQKYQRFEFSDWPRGTYATDTFQGTRAAGPIASAWAVMNTLGRAGYREIARIIMETKERLAAGIARIDGLRVVQPHDLSILLYASSDPALDIYAVADRMAAKGWFVGRSVTPRAIHLALNPLIAQALDDYLSDLAGCVALARAYETDRNHRPPHLLSGFSGRPARRREGEAPRLAGDRPLRWIDDASLGLDPAVGMEGDRPYSGSST